MKTILNLVKPTRVALMLVLLAMVMLCGCGSKTQEFTVRFNTCTELETNKIKDRTVAAGEKVSQPNLYVSDDKYTNFVIEGWYVDEAYTTKWDFNKDVVEQDMILYAKWATQYFIRYFPSNVGEPTLGVYVTEGEFAEKHDELATGYKVLGYYADPGYTIPFDFEQPITKDTDIYMRVSESLYWDAVSLKNNYTVNKASGDKSVAGEITVVEKDDETYAEIDFGYSEYKDPAIQTHGLFDISKSQKMTITYRNLGNSERLSVFWLIQYEDGTYSGPNGEYLLFHKGTFDIKNKMTEEDEWATVTVDMGELTLANGESQWSKGGKLTLFRIDSLYSEGDDEEFVPNIIQVKDITFEEGEVFQTVDTIEIEKADVFEVVKAGEEQEGIKNGYVFPKDRVHSTPKQGTIQYNTLDAATYLFPYGSKKGLVSYDMSHMSIDMETNPFLFLRYKNEGHSDKITIRYTTTEGEVGEKDVEVKSEMTTYSTLMVNMLKERDWKGQLASIDLIYHKVGADNLLSVQSIYLTEFTPSDIPGMNFNDIKCAGFSSTADYNIVYDTKGEATYIEMLTDEVSLRKNVSINTNVYDSAEFTYSVPVKGIESIDVRYQVGGQWYTHTIDKVKRTAGFETVSFPLEKKGVVTAMSIDLKGKGKLSLRSFEFKVNQEFALDFSDGKYIKEHFMTEWTVKYGTDHDILKNAASLVGDAAAEARCMFYLGASGYRENIHLSSKDKKIYVCYNNPGDARTVALEVYYASSENKTGSGIYGNDPTVTETKSVGATAEIKGNMKEGEWAVAVFDFSDTDLFSDSRNATMLAFSPGGDIYLRSIVLQ